MLTIPVDLIIEVCAPSISGTDDFMYYRLHIPGTQTSNASKVDSAMVITWGHIALSVSSIITICVVNIQQERNNVHSIQYTLHYSQCQYIKDTRMEA